MGATSPLGTGTHTEGIVTRERRRTKRGRRDMSLSIIIIIMGAMRRREGGGIATAVTAMGLRGMLLMIAPILTIRTARPSPGRAARRRLRTGRCWWMRRRERAGGREGWGGR